MLNARCERLAALNDYRQVQEHTTIHNLVYCWHCMANHAADTGRIP